MGKLKLALRNMLFASVPVIMLFSVSVANAQMRVTPTISENYWNSAMIKADGTLWTMGRNDGGQLGTGSLSPSYSSTPLQVGTDTDWVSVAAGNMFTVGLKSDGTIWAWGSDYGGALGNGDGDTTDHYSPIQVGTDSDWVFITTGFDYALAIKANGTLWGWGVNGYAQIATPGTITTAPVQIGQDNHWLYVSGGYWGAAGIKTDGTLWRWGADGGAGGPMVQVGTGQDWIMVNKGHYDTFAIKSDGTLWVWGYNTYGEFGNGTMDPSVTTPVQVGTDTDWVWAVPGDTYCSFGIKANGKLYSWGNNAVYQLGYTSPYQTSTPVQVGTDTNWRKVATRNTFSIGLKADGTLYHWGRAADVYGHIYEWYLAPDQVGFDTYWK